MAWRESQASQAPLTSAVGSMVFSSRIAGLDPATGLAPAQAEQQVANTFANLEDAMAKAGGSLADVGQVTLLLQDETLSHLVGPAWQAAFPDERTRPVRQTIIRKHLPYAIELQFVANLTRPQPGR